MAGSQRHQALATIAAVALAPNSEMASFKTLPSSLIHGHVVHQAIYKQPAPGNHKTMPSQVNCHGFFILEDRELQCLLFC